MKLIRKTRREWFGGIVYSEHPGFTAFVGDDYADRLGIPQRGDLPPNLFSSPIDVHLSITQRCNLKCQGCYVSRQREEPRDMSLAKATEIIDRLSDMNVFTIALGGGEPFLHPDLFAIAEYARSKQIVPNITTNGSLINRQNAQECRVFGNIHISCHEASELEGLSAVVNRLRREGIIPGVNLLVSSRSYAQLPNIMRWCSQHQVAQVLVLKFKLTRENREYKELLLTPSQEIGLIPRVRSLSRKYHLVLMLDCSLFPALAAHNIRMRDLEFMDVNGCQGGNAYLAITTDGRYKPCSFCETTFGTLDSLNTETWYQSEALQRFRQQRLHPDCHTCRYLDLCNGGCRVCLDQGCLANKP